jgi:hypothetical protein
MNDTWQSLNVGLDFVADLDHCQSKVEAIFFMPFSRIMTIRESIVRLVQRVISRAKRASLNLCMLTATVAVHTVGLSSRVRTYRHLE